MNQISPPSQRTPWLLSNLRAFTLVELLVVVAIIAVLVAMIMPNVGRMKGSASRATCASNLHQIGGGVSSYAIDHYGKIPPVRDPATLNGWLQEVFASSITMTGVESINSYGAKYQHGPVVNFWVCPGDPTRGGWIYRGAANGVPGTNESDTGVNAHSYIPNAWVTNRRLSEIPRPGQTILMTDFPWGVPGTRSIFPSSSPWKDNFPLDWHNNYINCLFVDGHVDSLLAKTIIWGGVNSRLWYSDYPSSGTNPKSQLD